MKPDNDPGGFNAILQTIKAIIILDIDGNKVLSKYYDGQLDRGIEKKIYSKTHRTKDEIVIIDGLTVLHKPMVDLHLYVIGSSAENPIILMNVLNCVHGALSIILRKQVERKNLMDSLDKVIILLDEICDSGVITEIEPTLAVQRVYLKDEVSDQLVTQVIQQARDQFRWSILR